MLTACHLSVLHLDVYARRTQGMADAEDSRSRLCLGFVQPSQADAEYLWSRSCLGVVQPTKTSCMLLLEVLKAWENR